METLHLVLLKRLTWPRLPTHAWGQSKSRSSDNEIFLEVDPVMKHCLALIKINDAHYGESDESCSAADVIADFFYAAPIGIYLYGVKKAAKSVYSGGVFV